jgi:hypothetical protein
MRRRSRASSVKSRRRKPAASKRSSGTEAARPRSTSAASQESELARLTSELAEARQEQKATADVLGIISSFPGELEPVFQAMLDNAVRVSFGGLFLREGEGFRSVAQQGPGTKHLDLWRQQPFLDLRHSHPGLPLSRVAATKQIVRLSDVAADRRASSRVTPPPVR